MGTRARRGWRTLVAGCVRCSWRDRATRGGGAPPAAGCARSRKSLSVQRTSALQRSELYLEHPLGEVITAQTTRDVFELECQIIDDPVSSSPPVVPKDCHPLVAEGVG